jgi:hypothetical protein
MSQKFTPQTLIVDSAILLRRTPVLLLPQLMAMSVSFLAGIALSTGIDPESVTDLESLTSSTEVQRLVMLGTAIYSVLAAFAHGVTSAMARVLLEKGATSMVAARQFVSVRLVTMLALSLILGLSTVVGLAVLLLPGLIITLVLMYAIPAFVMGESDPLGAVQKSITLVMGNFRESLLLFMAFAGGYMLLNIALMIFIFIPLFGILLAMFLTSSYMAVLSLAMLRAYIALNYVAGSGPAPSDEPQG